jgi:hypothetical protein
MTDSSFDDRRKNWRRSDGAGPSDVFSSLQGARRDGNCFAISRELQSDLLVCLGTLRGLALSFSQFVTKDLRSLGTLLGPLSDEHQFNDGQSWQVQKVIRHTRDLADMLSAVSALEMILFSQNTVGSPVDRQAGERTIQELVKGLRLIAQTSDVSDAGSRTPRPDGADIDGSLRGLFMKHREELSRLEETPP